MSREGGRFGIRSFGAPDDKRRWIFQSIMGNPKLPPIAQHLALLLHSYRAGPDGLGLHDIQAISGWSKTAVREAMSQLLDFGLVERQPVLCSYCGRWTEGTDCNSDHVLAKTRGGSNDEGNRVPCCKSCNSQKNNKNFLAWMLEIGGHH